jgi:hypothetical protein
VISPRPNEYIILDTGVAGHECIVHSRVGDRPPVVGNIVFPAKAPPGVPRLEGAMPAAVVRTAEEAMRMIGDV